MEDKEVGSNGKINIVPGFETYLGNFRVIHRMLKEMDVDYSFLSDPTEVLDTPADGEFRMYAGGTTQDEVKDAPNAIDTLFLQSWQSVKSTQVRQEYLEAGSQPDIDIPMGLEGTDDFLMKISGADRQANPRRAWPTERGRLVDMMTDSHAWLHGKKFALYGDADFVMGMTTFLLELGAEPTHILCNHANKRWKKAMEKMLANRPTAQNSDVHIARTCGTCAH